MADLFEEVDQLVGKTGDPSNSKKNTFTYDVKEESKGNGAVRNQMSSMPQHQNQQAAVSTVQLPDPNRGKFKVLEDEPALQQFEGDIKMRVAEYLKWYKTFQEAEGGLVKIGQSYLKMGLNLKPNGDIEYTEWAPAANGLTIFGDFNGWNRDEFRCQKDGFGKFSITLKANADGTPRIQHLQKYKI